MPATMIDRRRPPGHAQMPTDADLMRRVQADDPAAFGELYDRLVPRAMRIASGMGLDHDRAADAVQEGFVSIWRSRAQYGPERGPVHAWAFTIIRHRAIDSHRRNRPHERHRSNLESDADELRAPDDVQADAADHDTTRRLRALLHDLPEAQREVIVLAYYGELTHVEIASQLSVPIGTVKGRMRLGLAKLHERLAA